MQIDNGGSGYPFLKNGGEVGSLIRELKWADTPLGDPSKWPESLRTALGIILRSGVPMFLVWGSGKVFFYNDSFRPYLTHVSKHPESLGKPLKEALSSHWEMVSAAIHEMMDDGLYKSESNIILTVSRNNALQQAYVTLGYSAIFDDSDQVEGVFVTCTENSAVIPDLIASRSVRSHLNSVLMQSNAGIAQANIEGRVVEVNDRYCQMLGYSREQILQMNLGQLTHPDDLERNMKLLEECIANEKDFLITKRYVCKDGSIIWVNNSISLVTDEQGEKYITAIALDITAEKAKEEQLAASEVRFRKLIEKAPVGTALFRGREFCIELANEVMLEYWGKSTAIIGQKLQAVFPGTELPEFFTKLEDVFLTGTEHKTSGYSMQTGSYGTTQYFDYTLTPLLDETRTVYAVLALFSNVTDNVKAQQEIRDSQNDLASLFEQSPVGIATISIDEDLAFQSANIFYGELVGRKPEELIGKPLLTALPELKGQGFDELLKEVIRTGNAYIAKEVEVQLLRKGTMEFIYVDLIYQINRNTAGRPNILMVVATDVTRQVMSRRKVEESETMLQNLIASAPAGIGLFVGRDLIIDYPNQTFIDIVGKGPEVKGLPLREAMPELITEGQAYLKILDDIFTTGIPFISPASLVKIVQNGVLNNNYYNISYTPLRNKAGEIYAILDIAIDVTGQVLAQQAMEESEAHLQLLRDTVPAMIFYLDMEQRYQSYNSIFMEWFSVDEKQAIGKTVREFLGEIAYAKTLPHLKIAYEGQQEKYEMFAPSRMGISRWLSIVYTPHKNSHGQVIGVIVHATDITQSKLTEIALRDSETKFRSAVEVARLGTWSLDINTGISTVSERHAEMFGLTGTNVPSEQIRALIKPTDHKRVTDAFFAAQKQGSDGKYEAEYRIIHGFSGQEKVIHAVGQTYFDSEGKALVISGTTQDITIQRELQMALEDEVQLRTKELANVLQKLQESNIDLERSNAALRQSNEELAQFAYVASHDLQEPLRKIQIFAGLLQEDQSKRDPKVMVEKIAFSAARMSQLISDLLTFSRLVEPEKSLHPVDLNKVLNNIWIDFELIAAEKKAVFEIENLPVVQAVGLQMNQLFYNLMSNSMKFTNPDVAPQIKIRSALVSHEVVAKLTDTTLVAGNYYQISFSDNGIGFEKDFKNQIFEIFKRLHNQNIYPGSGIGLALCRRIVLNHQGFLDAESEQEKGSTFHIYLPQHMA